MSNNSVESQIIKFDNNNSATALLVQSNTSVTAIVGKLDNLIPYTKVILVLGGADELEATDTNRLTQLFGLGIARAAVEASAVIIDSGSGKGITSMMGEGVAARGYKTSIIGIAPFGAIKDQTNQPDISLLEPNHSHFIFVEGDKRGSETSLMFKLAQALATPSDSIGNSQDAPKSKSNIVPAIAILAGGGPIAKQEVLRAVRQNLPLIIIKGSGGVADEIVAAAERKDPLKEDPVIAEIIADGELHFHNLTKPVKGIERLIIRELGIDNVLMQAWDTFAYYDYNAKLQQKTFNRMQLSILFFGVFSTVLVISQQVFAPPDLNEPSRLLSADNLWKTKQYAWWLLHYVLIFIPILLTVLVTAANRFKQGSKWLLLRAGAESIKREIFRYRTRAMYYNEKPEQQLAQRIEDITRRTMRTEVNSSALKPYNKDEKDKSLPANIFSGEGDGKDDGFSYLVPDRYITIRLNDQAEFYRKKTIGLERQLNLLSWLTFIIGGVGSFLAAVGFEVWIAVTTSLVGAFATFLGYKQTERTLMKYNQSSTDLSNVKAWWNALSSEEQSDQKNIDSLVEHTEQVLQSELDGWIQQMQNALAELRDSQKKYEKTGKEEDATKVTQEGPFSKSASPPAEIIAREEATSKKEGEAGQPEVIRKAEIEENQQPLETEIGKTIISADGTVKEQEEAVDAEAEPEEENTDSEMQKEKPQPAGPI
ncbi:DUF4231 domain-containing protein [Segetibacter aerophilus]|uniref:SMODS and SLOG-associating 2TM effector domain-containing protein n=1 Tax=Segetibacter aerophilus TaxID=670293 RepID=A0A512BCY5_9BACT|nr:DUF4231 domain-containing protein [Segetibacter aerophilus]GEO09821.1 hypothetical protein SAE01_23170 [Segetibacter aerophilus]